ncbi:hypothetical protein QFC19_006848 [Naganishia cerealis]|uniref:Uncharacterized protein n=1 Tax=Naganishia cerealis TaxID=610337 RepID=A0ACC2VE23_9TREE|nr:hypothetical protein QFC19_006848 [Naganishia cerealis]
MQLTTLLSLALLSTSFTPCSATDVVLAQPTFHNSPIYTNGEARRRKRSASVHSHLSVLMAREEEKRQLGNAASSAADALSSAVGSVTRGKASDTVASSTPATPSSSSFSSSVLVPSSTPRVSQTPAVPVSSSTSSTTSPAITNPVTSAHTISETQGVTDVESSTTTSSTVSSSISSSIPASIQSTSTVTSAMSSASTDAQGSVSYVTSVETVRATASSTQSLANDVTSLETVFATASPTGNSSAAAASSTAGSNDSGGLSTGVIIAISVVGGVAVLAIGLFIIWKLKQKRFSGYDDDVDGIKWPELNRHGESSTMNLPLPAKPTGGHGFETNALERRMDLDDDGIDDYDAYSAPVSYANSANDHYGGYHESSPPLPSMGYMDNAHGAYGMSTIVAGEGVTLGRTKSSGGYSMSDEHHTPLGGTSAFEVDAPDMREMTGAQYSRGDDGHSIANLGRSRSGRLL